MRGAALDGTVRKFIFEGAAVPSGVILGLSRLVGCGASTQQKK